MWLELGYIEPTAGLLIFALLFYFVKNHVSSAFDPLVIQLLFISLSFSVYFFNIDRGINYLRGLYLILSFITSLFLFKLFFGKKNELSKTKLLAVNADLQFYVSGCIAIIMTATLLNNYIFGYSPLLQGTGHEGRVLLSGNNRFLEYSTRLLPGLSIIFLSSSISWVRRFSVFSIILGLVIFVLQGNRSGIIYPVFILMQIIFYKTLFGSGGANRLKYLFVLLMAISLIVLPAYVSSISSIEASSVYGFIFGRLFLTLDGLFIAGWAPNSVYTDGINLIVLYLQPIFKIFSLANGEYNSAMEYVNESVNGLIPGTYNGPTDNIFVEMLVTVDSIIIGIILIFSITFFFLGSRLLILKREKIYFKDICLMSFFITNPLTFVSNGYLVFVDAIFFIAIIFTIYFPYFIFKKIKYSRIGI